MLRIGHNIFGVNEGWRCFNLMNVKGLSWKGQLLVAVKCKYNNSDFITDLMDFYPILNSHIKCFQLNFYPPAQKKLKKTIQRQMSCNKRSLFSLFFVIVHT